MKYRMITGITLTLLLIGMLTLVFNIVPTTASLTVHNIDTLEDFATIQAAIDDSNMRARIKIFLKLSFRLS